jgi:hypothetical protein
VNKSIDYLKELRTRRYRDDGTDDNNSLYFKNKRFTDAIVNKLLNDPKLNDLEKIENIKKRADFVENKAKRDEKLLKISGGM